MKKQITYILFLLGILAISYPSHAGDLYGAKGAQQSSNLSLETMLGYAIQDEFLARAEYEHIIENFGSQRPFSNIIKAEENHINMLRPVFAKYGFQIPEDTAKDHIHLPKNLKHALETGVQAEIDNIAMYENFLNQQIPDDARSVFQRLKNASENHLQAFKNGLRKY